MRPGVAFPPFAATWTGASDAAYPAASAADLAYLSNVARSNGAGNFGLLGALTAPTAVQVVALVAHNLSAAATVRVRGYAGAAPAVGTDATVFDSGVIAAYPTGSARAAFRQTRPLVLSTPVTVQSVLVEMADAGIVSEVGAVVLAGWWEWPGIGYSRETGIDSRETPIDMVGGAIHTASDPLTPRQINGQIDFLALGALTNAGLDFQAYQQPVVYVDDADDPTTWPRLCLPVTNVQTPPLQGVAYRHDRFAFRFNEHYR